MIQKTRGIVLRSVKYGETSLIVSIYTETFGLQSYIVNGVRQASRKGSSRAGMFQPAAVLELVAYHSAFKNLHRLKEYRWAHLYQHLLTDVRRNAVALFLVELLGRCVKEPEPNPDLFYFVEDALTYLDSATDAVAANMPLFFALHLAVFFGFRINDEYSQTEHYLDLQEGTYVSEQPAHNHYLQDSDAAAVSQVLKALHPNDLNEVVLNGESRRRILSELETYYALHIPDFKPLRTVPVLREVLS